MFESLIVFLSAVFVSAFAWFKHKESELNRRDAEITAQDKQVEIKKELENVEKQVEGSDLQSLIDADNARNGGTKS